MSIARLLPLPLSQLLHPKIRSPNNHWSTHVVRSVVKTSQIGQPSFPVDTSSIMSASLNGSVSTINVQSVEKNCRPMMLSMRDQRPLEEGLHLLNSDDSDSLTIYLDDIREKLRKITYKSSSGKT